MTRAKAKEKELAKRMSQDSITIPQMFESFPTLGVQILQIPKILGQKMHANNITLAPLTLITFFFGLCKLIAP